MSDPYVGEIRMFAGNFAPRGWALCGGQLLPISQNDALFSLFGTIYGGDGRTTFALPDCRGRVPVHKGTGPGLTQRKQGAKGGVEQVTLTVNQIPSHAHGRSLKATSLDADSTDPEGKLLAKSTGGSAYHTVKASDQTTVAMHPGVLTNTGGSQPHFNLAPTLCLNFIVALVGIYPSRS